MTPTKPPDPTLTYILTRVGWIYTATVCQNVVGTAWDQSDADEIHARLLSLQKAGKVDRRTFIGSDGVWRSQWKAVK